MPCETIAQLSSAAQQCKQCDLVLRKRTINYAAIAAWTRNESITREMLRNRNRSSYAANLPI
eukprot:12725197-Alexandrium_andersonii.AAC.1